MSPLATRLQQVTKLISLPDIYFKINQLMDDPDSDIDDFAYVISMDANLTARLLNVVNSAYFGFSGEITSISKAIGMLGIHQLQIMVLSISAMTAVSSLNFPRDIVEFKTFWRCGLLSGSLARILARQMQVHSSERLFVLGMLHEIGHLFLYSEFPEQSRQAIQIARQQDLKIYQAEQKLLGYHYGEIGSMLMQNWQLPGSFLNLIRLQPTPQEAIENQCEISILHIAHAYAHKQFIEHDKELESVIDPWVWEITQLTPQAVIQGMDKALTASAEMEMALLK